ncbi:MAG TPA: tetratricopeptide repeat protein [Polyangiales bacterium]|nr:tetratricopeptide repeat protein [Polyangiales bacterium]
MIRLLFGLESVFSLWMLVDAVQRGAARYWYPVLFLPGGQLLYFFTVKVHDPEFRPLLRFWQRLTRPKVTLEQLRFRAQETPSFANKLALAQGLYDAAEHEEAASCFAAVLAVDDESKNALYGYAMCQLELESYERAIAALEQLIEIQPSFQEYAAWAPLAFALSKVDRRSDALELLDKLVRKSSRLEHRVLYASYLYNGGEHDKARDQLQQGMRGHKHAPRFQRRQEAAAAKKARAMLSQLEAN